VIIFYASKVTVVALSLWISRWCATPISSGLRQHLLRNITYNICLKVLNIRRTLLA
jgi:hypothetical protein